MPTALVATAGASDANTYVTRADATTYFGDRLNTSAWTNASSDEKDQSLLAATAILDRVKWAGSKASSSQALAWPRGYAPTLEFDATRDVIAEDFVDETLVYYDEDEIPGPIVHATCELALVLLQAGTTDPFAADAKRVKSITVDVISTEYFDSQDAVRGLGRFPHVLQLVAHLFRASAHGIEVHRA